VDIADLKRKSHHAIDLSHIQPLGMLYAGIESDTEGLFEVGGEYIGDPGARTIGGGMQHGHATTRHLRYEDIAVRGLQHFARSGEAGREDVDAESRRYGQLGLRRFRYHRCFVAR